MALELKQQLKLSQQLVMTPQLQQAIKLLQLSRLELVNLVTKELEENPVLEEGLEGDSPEEGETQVEPTESVDEAGEPVEATEAAPEASASVDVVPGEEPPATRDEPEGVPTDAEKVADVDWRDYMDSHPQTGIREARDDDSPPFEATLTRRSTLSEHLLWQLYMDPISDEERYVAEFIVGNLDERGYLLSSTEEIVRQSGVGEEVVESVLARIQLLDPVGTGARNLRECLLIQVRVRRIRDPLVIGIIEEVLDLLINRDFRGVARHLGTSIEAVAAAAKIIGGLEPRPGRGFGGDDPTYIVPDIYVYKIADDFHVVLNDDGLPRLRISSLYRAALAKGSDTSKETKAYIHDKVRSALWLIKSIHQRQRTIYKVMQSIIKFQRDFFEKGINHLRPLNLRDVADDIEMHESTVSRVTTNKYAHTPQGIFELKYFFNSSIRRLDGESIASESVKDRISHLIRNEDSRRPLSDQRIAEMLRVHNINIARRTVTKYRESLNLLSSTKRREVG